MKISGTPCPVANGTCKYRCVTRGPHPVWRLLKGNEKRLEFGRFPTMEEYPRLALVRWVPGWHIRHRAPSSLFAHCMGATHLATTHYPDCATWVILCSLYTESIGFFLPKTSSARNSRCFRSCFASTCVHMTMAVVKNFFEMASPLVTVSSLRKTS